MITGCDHRGVVAAHSQLALLAATIRTRQPFTHFVSVPLADAGLKTRYLQFQEDVLGRCQRVRSPAVSIELLVSQLQPK